MLQLRTASLAFLLVACGVGAQHGTAPKTAGPVPAADLVAPTAPVRLRAAEAFSFVALIERAQARAQAPYEPPVAPPADILERIDYDAHGKLTFKTDHAPSSNGPGQYPVTFFHLGRYFRVPVRIHWIEGEGGARTAREIEYDESYFEMPKDSPARELPRGSGFAGLRFQESRLGDQRKLPWQKNDWVAFLGATYFRAIGELYQYGLSARAIAVDVAESTPEEFPSFTHLYIETSSANSALVTLYGIYEGPSVVGAVRFDMERKQGVLMEVTESLFLRRDVKRLGLAPLTSMYWFSEKSKDTTVPDWRPEVHDSDGLALWTGAEEHIWRPLNNPPRTTTSSFVDENPKGFGLSQRDRVFDHYLDGVRYERRPSLWVEPLGSWGRGSVQLVEIPTDDEIHDNVVAMWVPEAPARAGARYDLKYRLHWFADEPRPSPLARVVATRMGRGGQPGQARPRGVRKFVVEMAGGPLSHLPYGVRPEAELWASRGTFSYVFTEAVPNDVPGHWRAQFDLSVEGEDPVEIRMYLRRGEEALSETWLYQWHPR